MRKVIALSLSLPLLALAALSVGAVSIPDIWSYIFNPFFDSTSTAHQIIWDIRAPRIAAAIVVGASLGIAGVLGQGATNNPLADPAFLGTTAGASVGVLIGIIFNVAEIGSISAVIFAAVGALAATLATFSLARSALQLIIIGIGVSAILSATAGLIISIVARPEARSVSFWSLGSLALVTSENLYLLVPVLIATVVAAFSLSRGLDLLSLGDFAVRHIGVNPQRVRLKAFVILSVVVATAVSTVGTISFLALASPHIARFIVGPRHRNLFLTSAFVGALILLVADTAARSVAPPQDLPIGLIISLIGAPILILALKRGGLVWR
jgi:iron complex transport system permease protein